MRGRLDDSTRPFSGAKCQVSGGEAVFGPERAAARTCGRQGVAAAAPPRVGSLSGGLRSPRWREGQRRAQVSVARREWVCAHAAVSPAIPVWGSRSAWIADVRAWTVERDFGVVRDSVRVSITSATLVAVAVVWAAFANHHTGRNAAVTRETIAVRVGCDVRTVSRAWKVLGAAGWAIEAQRGHGSADTPSAGKRPSIWHLVPRRKPVPQPVPPAGDPVEFVHLPPKGVSSSLPPVQNYSPSAPAAAPGQSLPRSADRRPQRRRRSRTTPRPMALQRLAGQLVTASHGLDHGHIGGICDAITSAEIDPHAWTARQLCDALNADMRARGTCWPDHIENPAAFLATRLRRLPARPDAVTDLAARRGASSLPRQETTAPQPARRPATAQQRAHAIEMFGAMAARRRHAPGREPSRHGMSARPMSQESAVTGHDMRVRVRGSAMTVGELLALTPAGRCVGCGSIDATMRTELPLPCLACDACYRSAGAEPGGGNGDGCPVDHGPGRACRDVTAVAS